MEGQEGSLALRWEEVKTLGEVLKYKNLEALWEGIGTQYKLVVGWRRD